MGCLGDRERGELNDSQKWDYITLPDFHPSSSFTPISYAWLWFLAIVSVAVYAADTFTAVNLLALDRWSSQIQPAIPFNYSRWIFAGCIIASFALCAYEWQRAIRVIRRGAVAESYMDPLAVSLQSMRGQGWKRFLVFAELTKSKKGVDYIALFVYFQFKGAVRIILAEGARQVINALTLYSVMQADLVPTGDHAAKKGQSPILQFFTNVGTLYNSDKEQAIMLFTMLFTLVIWVISALSLLLALILYLVFLWHYIPQEDGRLSIYCRRKIDRRLAKIVESKVRAAIEDQERKRRKEEMKMEKMSRKKDLPAKPTRKPTLPLLDEKPDDFGLVRRDTESTLPLYSSRPPTRNEMPGLQRQPTLPDLGVEVPDRPGMPSRSATQASGRSNMSYASNAPLLHNADSMGYDVRSYSPEDDMPPMHRQMSSSTYLSRPPPTRSMTSGTQGSYASSGRPGFGPRMPVRSNTGFSFDDRNPLSRQGSRMADYPVMQRQNTQQSFSSAGSQPNLMRQDTQQSWSANRSQSTLARQDTQVSAASQSYVQRQLSRMSFSRSFSSQDRPSDNLASTSQHQYDVEMSDARPIRRPSAATTTGGSSYIAFNPNVRSASTVQPPQRNMTSMGVRRPANGESFGLRMPQRSATAPPPEHAYDGLIDEY